MDAQPEENERSPRLPTSPYIAIDRQRLERNLQRMAQRAADQQVALRPHIKTHRSIDIAHRQVALGARGITCAKAAEATVFAAAGFNDLRIAYSPVDPGQLQRLASLARDHRVSWCVESTDGVARNEALLRSYGTTAPIEVLLEVDTGYGRAGVPWDHDEELRAVAAAVSDSERLRLVGVLTHAGHGYAAGGDPLEPGVARNPSEELRRIAREERDRVLRVADLLHDVFELAPQQEPQLSIGSTPTAHCFEAATSPRGLKISEIRPGNYVFHDLTQVAIGVAELDDCALTVQARVVTSRRRADSHHLLLDGGKKILTSDATGHENFGGFGLILDPAAPDEERRPLRGAQIHSLSEEHAWARLPTDVIPPRVGNLLRIVPNHSCVVQSTANRVYLEESGCIRHRLYVQARTA